MKKTIIKVLALSLVAVMMCAILVSCSTLSGKYTNKTEVFGVTVSTTYEFDGDEFTMTTVGGISVSGTYEIDGDEITFTVEGVSNTVSFEKVSGGIKIDGTEYTKD